MGGGESKRGDVFLFDVIQAESQSAHVNELENAIKNIYIHIRDCDPGFSGRCRLRSDSSPSHNQRHQLFSVINASPG